MKKFTTAVLAGSALLIFTACSTNTPDMSYYTPKQKLVQVNSKKYLIPRNTDQYFIVSKDQEKAFKQMKVSCRQGDIHWSTKKAQDIVVDVVKKNSKEHDSGKLYFFGAKEMHKRGGMGCAKVVTSKQKNAYLRELRHKQEMIDTRLSYIQSQKPIRYEVKHTGYVIVDVLD